MWPGHANIRALAPNPCILPACLCTFSLKPWDRQASHPLYIVVHTGTVVRAYTTCATYGMPGVGATVGGAPTCFEKVTTSSKQRESIRVFFFFEPSGCITCTYSIVSSYIKKFTLAMNINKLVFSDNTPLRIIHPETQARERQHTYRTLALSKTYIINLSNKNQ